MKENGMKAANVFRFLGRYLLLLLGILVFLFALVSGSESYGGGIAGIIKNSPNAIPWLFLLILIGAAWRWELTGGIMITVLGMVLFYFLNLKGPNFFMFTFFLTLVITVLGSFFIMSALLRRSIKQAGAGKGLKNPGKLIRLYWMIIIICLAFAGLCAHKRQQEFNVPPDRTSILKPGDGDQVNNQIMMMGEFTQADSLKDLWLAVQQTDSVQFHPQPGPCNKPPRRMQWYATAYFGSPDEAPGKQYRVYLFSATEEASKILKDYIDESQKTGHWPGLKSLPAGMMPLDTIWVVRK